MKKLSFMLLSLLAVALFTACGDGDEPVNKQTVSMTINNRAIDGDQVVFSQANAKVELNYTDMTIQLNTEYKDAAKLPHSIATPMMKMTNVGGTIYSFGQASSDISGYIDFATGMTWFTIDDINGTVVSTSQLLYAYSTTTVTNPDNGFNFSHEQSAYLFAVNPEGETCTLSISNFIPNIAGSVEAGEMKFNDLTMVPTATGYTITASEVESYNKSYTITDLNFTLNNQCRTINGSFKCRDLEFKVSGNLFPIAQ